jgi:Putative beta-lactamase-inhibitor-like, PepSY-like
MNKLILVLIGIASLISTVSAQVVTVDKVPASVKQALQSRFPDLGKVEWKISRDKDFEAEFSLKSIEITVKFDPAGKWLETETQIPLVEVPKAVIDVLANKFKGHKIVETQSLRLFNDSKMIYEIHLDNNKEVIKALLYADGTVLSQSAKAKK